MKYPIGIQDFRKLRNEGFVYVDKTEYIYKMAEQIGYYFLSRPRRFGKSLMVSTLEEYFSGNKQLFKGLALEKLETEWVQYPVLHLDFNTGNYSQEGALEERLQCSLSYWETNFDLSPSTLSAGLRFESIITKIYEKTGKQAVILIDEYDKPLLHNISNPELFEKNRNTLKAFYSVMKSHDRYIRFGFLTGVTRFGKVSVFSDLNNLDDISDNPEFSGICGITEKEMHQYFDGSIQQLADYHNVGFDEMCQTLRKNYDGYHFSPHSEGVYNPFSLISVFKSKQLKDYWFESGTPTFLIDFLKKSQFPLYDLEGATINQSQMKQSIDSIRQNVIPVIYQSGYLTIKDYDKISKRYILGFPNEEVARGFTEQLVEICIPSLNESNSSFDIMKFRQDVVSGNPESLCERLQSLFSDMSYEVVDKFEKHFQDSIYLLFKLLGFYVDVERRTSQGRIDVTIGTEKYVYIIEMKVDKSAVEALQQIEDKQYAAPFAKDERQLFKIGINFNSETRTVSEWVIK